ncbi:hypothetical protein Tco_0950239 [Tanacetum coccineum]
MLSMISSSVIIVSALDALCERFHIPDVVHPELPGRNDTILNSPDGKISLSVIAAAKVSHFEILCRVHGFVPTIDMHIKEQVPEQVRDQVPVYVAEGLILERQKTKEEMEG